MCFWFITQTDYIQVFLRTLADVSVHDIFLLHSSSSSLIYYAAGGGLRPSRSSASSNKIRRWIGKRKTPVRNARNYHLCLSRLKNFVEILGVQVFALMQKMLLSERQRVQHFSVSFLVKFCTSWYFRIFDLSQFQRILHMQPSSWSLHFIIPFSPGILYHFFNCP